MEVNQEGTSLDSAASAISQLRQPEEVNTEGGDPEVSTQEIVSEEEVVTEEVQEPEKVEETEEVEVSEPEAQAEGEEEELHEWTSLEELMEAAGLDQEKFESLKTKRKINGQEEEVTLAELRAANQRDEDYRRKTMELSEKRKAFEDSQSQFLEEQQSKVQHTDLLINQLGQQLTGEYQSIDWNGLRDSDPAEYAAKRQEFQERQQQLNHAVQQNNFEKQQLEEQTTARQQQEYASYLQEQEKLLISKMPEWGNAEVKSKKQGEIRDYLKAEGFSDEEIAQTADHRHILMLQKAMAFDALDNKSAPKLQKLKTIPKVVKPGAKVSKTEAQQTQKAQLMQKAKKSGDINDAAALIKSLRK